ncbi:MAG: site-specific DNA-methyltransferase [Termitinemataceae bacterium]|nr:MAG: site-specific DNA-methyltransferase [Termitinemataceae bacterium]
MANGICHTPRLELTWIGKENRPKLEPRILISDDEKSYHAKQRRKADIFDNRLIFGDNLLALKALEQEFTGKVKCIYIDPPYNTGSAFEHYDDGLEHSIWLGLMRDRLEMLRRLLSDDGSIWISIDDNEQAYLKIVMDEIFGRPNFVTSICWQKIHSIKNDAKLLSVNHDFILLYTKNIDMFNANLLSRTETMDGRYKNPDSDPRGAWQSGDLVANETRVNGNYIVTNPITGKKFTVEANKHWVYSQENLEQMIAENRIWFGKDGNAFPRKKRFLSEVQQGRTPDTWWTSDEVGHNQEAKREIIQLFSRDTVFATPKPEKLIARILNIATNPGDLVLDSFAGSGTTGAVAHKMGRRWIMIELGEHCHTHIIPRLKKVIDGTDQGGITESTKWGGGGGFRYYRLAPSLMQKDKFGNWVINKQYNAAQLSQAICKLEGFTYSPSDTIYWIHGVSNENDFIYVTTQSLTNEHLAVLSDEVGKKRTLLVMCTAFRQKAGGYHNLTVKKIPNTVLSKCEWGHDDYSLQIQNLPLAKKMQAVFFDEEEE